MVTKKRSGRVPENEAAERVRKSNYDVLAESARQYWGDVAPSNEPMARYLVYESSFMDTKNPLPVFKEKLPGSRLIDLGAGEAVSYLSVAYFAAVMGMREYVAVDVYVDYSAAEAIMRRSLENMHTDMEVRAVNDDMLRYVADQPDCSAHICMNCVDHAILRHGSPPMERMYITKLLEEIARVVPLDGIAFGANSPFLARLQEIGFVRCKTIISEDHGGLFIKKE